MILAATGYLLSVFLCTIWVLAAVATSAAKRHGHEPGELALGIFHELRPFYRTLVLAQVVFGAAAGLLLLSLFYAAFFLWIWKLLRDADDGDDRWKRRRRNLARKVQVVGGQLTVVPAGAR
ncbi:hypothetical protein [Micromonospora sp. NPDC005652]|uniref:hypothetical protein n=1 Tax=Micromonospora sp. NPDC005652 TaxID=3157046 RepID=UPI0033E05D35